MKNKIFQHNSNLVLRQTFSLTPEEAMVDDLAKACGTYKMFCLMRTLTLCQIDIDIKQNEKHPQSTVSDAHQSHSLVT